MYNDLREYIKQADELGECKLIEGADWDLEIGTIAELIAKPGAPMLLFDKIKGYPAGYRVATNLVTSQRRVCLLWGLPDEETPTGLIKAWREKTKGGFKPVPPVEVETGPVKENIFIGDDVDLFMFPTPKWHEFDGGRYIGTGNIVVTRDPDEDWINLGVYRIQIYDKTTATIHIDEGHHGNVIRRKYWDKGQACPVAVACGQDPLLYYAASMQIPARVSEYDYAGWLRNRPIEVVRGEVTDLPIPATAEIVLEGEMVPPETETRIEGPFGEYTGYYAGKPKPVAAFRVKSILHRNNPILMGEPPISSWPFYWWDRNIPRAALIWEAIDKAVPGVKGVWLMDYAGIAIPVISIQQRYAGQAKEAALIAMTLPFVCRFIIVVDDDIDPSNVSEVIWALGTRCDPETSIDIIRGTVTDQKDPIIPPERRAREEFSSSTAIIMACKPFGWMKEYPPTIRSSPELLKRVKEKWAKLIE